MIKYLFPFNNKKTFDDLESGIFDEKDTCIIEVKPEHEIKKNNIIKKIFFWKKEKSHNEDCFS